MKIYQTPPTPPLVRIVINKIKTGNKPIYMTSVDTTIEETKLFLEKIIELNAKPNPFEIGHKTSIVIRDYIDRKNGKSISLSFRGLTPEELEKLIIEELTREVKID